MRTFYNNEGIKWYLQDACERAGSQRAWAASIGVSAAYVSDVLNGRREVSDTIARALGFERIVSFQKLGAIERLNIVYVLSDPPFAKIGVTNNLHQRMKLQWWPSKKRKAERLKVYRSWETNGVAFAVERQVKAILKGRASHGHEWFRIKVDELVSIVDGVVRSTK